MERPDPELGTQTETTVARIVAWLVDGVVLGVGFIILTRITDSFFVLSLFWIVGSFVYRTALEAMYGQTVGKMALKIVVVKENGDPCDVGAAASRNLLRVVDALFFYLIGLVVILVSDDNQRVGDIAASTIVTKVRTGPVPPNNDTPEGDFVIELHEDTANGERYVELINQSGREVDLSRATLLTASGDEFRFPQGEAVHNAGDSKTFLVPDDFVIAPNSSVTLVTNTNERFTVKWSES